MIRNLPADKILQAARRTGAQYAELFAEQVRQTTIVFDDRRLEHLASFGEAGVSIRALANGRCSSASTCDLTRQSLFSLARAVSNTLCSCRTRPERIALAPHVAPPVTTARRHPSGVSFADKCAAVLSASEIAWQAGPGVRQVRILYRDTVRRIWIATSEGIVAEDEQVDTILSAHVVASDGTSLQTGYEIAGGAMGCELFDEHPPEEIAERAARRALQMLTARPAPAGTMAVVLSAEAGGTMIHEAVGHGLEGDLAGAGLSVYSGRMGEAVASPLVSVADDATLAGRRGSFTFDDEGFPASRTILIDEGILKSYLTDWATAKRYHLPLTGNGRRQSHRHLPLPRMTNTLTLPGKDDPAAILADTPRGLFVRKIGGGQVNTLNGDFVFDVQEGFLIEGGKLGEPVRGATLIGNGPKILMEIDRVGRDLGFSIGACGKEGQELPVSCGQPTLRIPTITVGGTQGVKS